MTPFKRKLCQFRFLNSLNVSFGRKKQDKNKNRSFLLQFIAVDVQFNLSIVGIGPFGQKSGQLFPHKHSFSKREYRI
jgi:hypothetical protein